VVIVQEKNYFINFGRIYLANSCRKSTWASDDFIISVA